MSVTFLGPLSAGGIKLPLLSLSSVGSRSPVVEKHVSIAELCEVREPHVYLARVEDEGMQGSGMRTGDMLVVDRSQYAEHGDIVVASLNARQMCRRLHMRGDVVILKSEHPDYPPLHVTDHDDLIILGVVTYSLKNLLEGRTASSAHR
ncbi:MULTISPECIES: LexA family protein [Pseudomonas]|uniref:Ultraviolet light resistance protein RulA n=8 Tax=Pseudomonas syringae group TaxID=136849 RepID=A0A2K4WXK2_PSESX|nr:MULTISPECIES: S24 family peptidase [Pseudomonas]AAZ34369.1 ultraviolet light resistance protein RulA, putative [Pseudomonas savastanoi pv. phaseolicola 1448A]AVB14228.1 RulA protein [Pseudomonas amygdali pv. morsprunorum]KPX35491.1 putative Ultraviolet light resistance protein RulA [Pseudomonas savastanoi pv. glycinea]KPX46224.1 putative Ultraviolet light resistance protein RulA [Pseudomonas ficuserectae]KPY10533.1 putative Ultraviolet light resistance protein RulA [Pseudomonas savastanoi p